MRRRASLRRFVTALLLIGLLTACGSHQTDRPDARTGLTVGATADAGSMVLANLYAAALRYFGSPAQVEVVADPLAALDSGQLDVVPGFTGRLLQTFASGTSSGYGDEQVYRTLLGTLPEGITAGDYTTAAEDKPAAAVTGPTVAAWGGRDLTELVGHCGQVRPGTVRGVTVPTRVGTCKLPEPIEFDDSAALFAALKSNRINVAWTSTADPAVPEDSDGPQGTVLLADHINLTGATPLVGPRFVDLTDVYSPALRDLATNVDPTLEEGIYCQFHGPAYETPSEVRMARAIGGTLVGMSTALEAIAAREAGLEVLGISLVTNAAAGIAAQPLSHAEVVEAGLAAQSRLSALLGGLLERL